MNPLWRIELLGSFALRSEDTVITRFRTRRVGLLLARLALPPNRPHGREELGELLWPEMDPEVIRRNLRQALTSLRKVLEPPPVPFGTVLQVHQATLQLAPSVVASDVEDFELAISRARWKKDPNEAHALLLRAVEAYRGDLLPGFTEDWVAAERLRLEDQYVHALRSLVNHCLDLHRDDEAIQYMRLALAKEPLNEEWHLDLMRQYLRTARPANAIRQFDELRHHLREGLGCEPSLDARALLAQARQRVQSSAKPEPANSVQTSPARPPTRARSTLPVTFNRFCGRQDEIEATVELLSAPSTRLVTLLGPAGAGKTRLSIEVGRQIDADGDQIVVFVPLADLSDPASIPEAILDALRVRRVGGSNPWEHLLEVCAELPGLLLVLDNFEHVADEGAELVARLMAHSSTVRVLVTSRRPLQISAEHCVEVSPLPYPSEVAENAEIVRTELATLLQYPSVRLYVDRCQAVRPDFQITPANAATVVAICARLEGLPLALELAAGLSGAFSPRQILRHIQDHLVSLATRRRDAPPRHRSLRAAIEYSYGTLPPEVQRFFAALSVFRGGFSLAAAHEVCFVAVNPDGSQEECMETLIRLREHSLLSTSSEGDDATMRFRMLESFREFAEEVLPEGDRDTFHRRHAEFFRRAPLILTPNLSREARTQRHLEIESDFDNGMTAAAYFWKREDAEATFDVMKVIASTWMSRGPRAIERSAIREVAGSPLRRTLAPAKQVELLRMLGTTYLRSSEFRSAKEACQEALQIAQSAGLAAVVPYCHAGLATCSGFLGELDECEHQNQLALASLVTEDAALLARAHLGIGAVRWGRGDILSAETEYRIAEQYSAQVHGGEPDVQILCNLARVDLDLGRFDEAMEKLGVALEICRRLNDDLGRALCLTQVGRYHWLRANYAIAHQSTHESLGLYRDAGFSHLSLVGIFHHALVRVAHSDWKAATVLLAATRQVVRVSRAPDEADHRWAVDQCRANLTSSEFESFWAEGLAMSEHQLFRFALQTNE